MLLVTDVFLRQFATQPRKVVLELEHIPSGQIGFVSISALVNIILAALIVFRLIYHRRHVRKTLGVEHGSPYTNIMTMLVESSALMVISGGLYSILYLLPLTDATYVASNLVLRVLPHIYVGGLGSNDF